MLDLGIWVIIAALVGAKALLFVVDFRQFTSSWADFTSLLRSGGVFYGGLIAAVVVCIYQLKKHRLPLWTSADLFAPGIALGYMVGRLGLPDGRLLLRACNRRGLGHHVHRSGRQSQRRHAAQRAAAPDPGVRVARRPGHLRGRCVLLERRGRGFPGRTFWTFVLLYAVSRFIIEFYRGDDRGFVFSMVSTSQAISLVLVPLSLFMLWYLGRPRAADRAGGAARAAQAAVCLRS